MSVQKLGYVVIGSRDLDAWHRFACEGLGLMATSAPDAESGAALQLRIDERPMRIRVEESQREGLIAVGWEVANHDEYESTLDALKREGVDVAIANAEGCATRCAREVAQFRDPSGNPHEIYSATIFDHRPFVSPVGGSGFITGDEGMGHVVLPATDVAATRAFFERVLGFRLSDSLQQGPFSLAFMRCNPRHHSVAFASLENPTGLIHFMLQAKSLDDVGYALDRVQAGGYHLSATLGKHTNDQMVSFYVRTPSGFDVEFGCGGLRVDEASWSAGEITAPSFWGHRWDYGQGA